MQTKETYDIDILIDYVKIKVGDNVYDIEHYDYGGLHDSLIFIKYRNSDELKSLKLNISVTSYVIPMPKSEYYEMKKIKERKLKIENLLNGDT